MTGQPHPGVPQTRVQFDVAQSGEDLLGIPFRFEHPLDGHDGALGRLMGKDEGAPGDAEGDAERGFVGAVAADVTDHDADGAILHLDGVEEVATEESPAPAGLVPGGPAQAGIADHRLGDQTPLEPGVLRPQYLRLPELAEGFLAVPPGNGVPDGADQCLVVDAPFD